MTVTELRRPRTLPGCGCWTARTIAVGSDRLYGTTDEIFSVIECHDCGLLRLDPGPHPPSWVATILRTTGSLRRQPGRQARGTLPSARARRPCPIRPPGAGRRPNPRSGTRRGMRRSPLRHGCLPNTVIAASDSITRARRPASVGVSTASRWCAPACPRRLSRAKASPPSPCSMSSSTCTTPASYLDAARELLVQDGRLIVQVPNASCWQLTLFGDAWNGLDIPRHLIDFRAKDLEALLSHCGFKVLRHKHFSLRDNPAGLASTLAPSLDPMARRVRGASRARLAPSRQGPALFWVRFGGPSDDHRRGRLRRRIDDHDRGRQTMSTLPGAAGPDASVAPALRPPFRGVDRRCGVRVRRAACPTSRSCSTPAPAKASIGAWFAKQRYVGLDLGIGDPNWNYRGLDAIADLRAVARSQRLASMPR